MPIEVFVFQFRKLDTGSDESKVVKSGKVVGHRDMLNVLVLQNGLFKDFKLVLWGRSPISDGKQLAALPDSAWCFACNSSDAPQ